MTTAFSYAHVARAVYGRPLMVAHDTFDVIDSILQFRLAGGHLSDDEIRVRLLTAAGTNGPRTGRQRASGVAVIPIYGVIANHMGGDMRSSGGTTVDAIRADFREALASEDVGSIVFDVDSPGGSVDGIEELAAEIRAARGQKPMAAVANVQMDSAAFYLGAQADEVVVTPSGRVGSVGVLFAHRDLSKKAEIAGEKTTFITYGKFKAEGNSQEPMTEEGIAYAQSQVDEYGEMFVAALAAARGITAEAVRSGYGQGRELLAKPAKAAGMVDRIDTLENTIRRAAAGRIKSVVQPSAGAGAYHVVHPLMAEDAFRAETVDLGFDGAAKIDAAVAAAKAFESAGATQFNAGAIGIHHGTTDNGAFDGPAVEASIPNSEGEATFRRMYAWIDPSGNADAKASFRFIHHFWRGAPGPASTRGCAAGIGVLNGARGGTTIPDADKPGVHAHLAAHMRDAGMEPPTLNAEVPAGSGTGLPFTARLEAVTAEMTELVSECEKRSGIRATEGRDLSAATREQLALLVHRVETLVASAPERPSPADARAQARARLAVMEAAARAGYRFPEH